MINTIGAIDWSQFKSIINREILPTELIAPRTFLFRGQGSSGWRLASSFDRLFPRQQYPTRYDIEKQTLDRFRRECEQEDDLRDVVGEPATLMALAQHHGLPTRLLDWTHSPYFAAFFAFESRSRAPLGTTAMIPQNTVAVWCLDKRSAIWTAETGVEIVSPARWRNERMLAQDGAFTLSRTPFDSLEDYVNQFPPTECRALTKIEVPVSAAREALTDLRLMGVTPARLFPGRDGMARSALAETLHNVLAR